ncbi:Tyrosine-protein phosphatase non-receptor type 14 [Hypsizygus marmoreus]|uniref:Tyrosine-protein phosphatase non-receptor type 14 n=1 Tax=Hypsizygus marmoreus TaxID=39966 RepID=A0A369JDC5_HYPMA|nr:Tyrosine-protein phosphatase non-receptor type 14 [Hypsizygus marmoreus]
MASSAEIPLWLAKHTSHSHIRSVYHTLADREQQREIIRYLSKQSESARAAYSKQISRPPKLPLTPEISAHYSVAIASQPENVYRNRYLDIEPYDRTRVVVGGPDQDKGKERQETENMEDEDKGKYLNANWVRERFGGKWWIATQAPLPNTAHTFLSVFLHPIAAPPKHLCPHTRRSRIRTVVQLTKDVEGGRRKAHSYFPSQVGQSLIVASDDDELGGGSSSALKVTLVRSRIVEEAHCIHSTISVVPITHTSRNHTHTPDSSDEEDELEDDEDSYGTESQDSVTFNHMLYTSWPDHGVPDPSHRASLLAFLHLVDSTNRDRTSVSPPDPDPDPPIVVGCSAGVGRSGSFIALSSLLRSFGFLPAPHSPESTLPPSPLGDLPSPLGEDLVAQEVDSLREQRPGMVQRDQQILLIYEVLSAAFGNVA